MNKTVLITGAYGFIGRYTAKHYKDMGYIVIGLGHGSWGRNEYSQWGIDYWYSADITLENLVMCEQTIDIIVHCAGSGSVSFSIENPMIDFERNVWTTNFILEYIRQYSKNTKLIYLSSAAVYGLTEQLPIVEECTPNPISPYGLHKKIAEELCQMYACQYGISVIIMRLFSVYGKGLKKQLLWDACKKIENGNNVFWGTGGESRDWIHVEEVAKLLQIASSKATMGCPIVNIASGENISIETVLIRLFQCFDTKLSPQFGGEIDKGNPTHYLADIKKIQKWNWINEISLDAGIKDYVMWYKAGEEN